MLDYHSLEEPWASNICLQMCKNQVSWVSADVGDMTLAMCDAHIQKVGPKLHWQKQAGAGKMAEGGCAFDFAEAMDPESGPVPA